MKFIVMYQMPHTGLDAWMQLPEAERKAQEMAMQSQWNAWLEKNGSMITETVGVGRPKRVTKEGVEDARNDLMMYSFVEADSAGAAADLFKDHPHFGIPGAWIEVMPLNKNIS